MKAPNCRKLMSKKYIICCYCSVAKLCTTLCDPMNYSTPGFSVLPYLPEFAQAHVHWVSDAIQSSHPLLSPSPLALNLWVRIWEWVAISFTRESSPPRDQSPSHVLQADSLLSEPPGKPSVLTSVIGYHLVWMIIFGKTVFFPLWSITWSIVGNGEVLKNLMPNMPK